MFKNADPYAAMEAGEVGLEATGDFADKIVRQGFIRKVFGASLCYVLEVYWWHRSGLPSLFRGAVLA